MSQNIDMAIFELVISDSVQPVHNSWTDMLLKLTKVSVLHCYLWKKYQLLH